MKTCGVFVISTIILVKDADLTKIAISNMKKHPNVVTVLIVVVSVNSDGANSSIIRILF